MSENEGFDWVQSMISIAACGDSALKQIANAACLDPVNSDFIDIDFSEQDLRDQDLSGWDLRYAVFRNAKISGANLRGSVIDVYRIVDAHDWEQSHIDDDLRTAAMNFKHFDTLLRDTSLSVRTYNILALAGIFLIGDLVRKSRYDVSDLPMIGAMSLIEIETMLSHLGLRLGMNFFIDNNGQQRSKDISGEGWGQVYIKNRKTEILSDQVFTTTDAALLLYSMERKIEVDRITSCKVGKGRFIEFDGMFTDKGAITLISVKNLHTTSSAANLIRIAVNRKAVPIAENASIGGISIIIVFIFVRFFSTLIGVPNLPQESGVTFRIYDFNDIRESWKKQALLKQPQSSPHFFPWMCPPRDCTL